MIAIDQALLETQPELMQALLHTFRGFLSEENAPLTAFTEYTTALQDRIIKLEMRVRCATVLSITADVIRLAYRDAATAPPSEISGALLSGESVGVMS